MLNRKWKFFIGLLIALFILTALILKIIQGNAPKETVREISPAYGNIQSVITTTGTVQPQNRLEIKPPISGRVEEILVKEGEKVKVGQILAWMSSTERAAILDVARAQGEESLKYWQEAYKPIPLIAPIDGDVIVRAVEPGQTVTSGDSVLVLSDRLIVKAQVDETDIGKVKIDRSAVISLDAYPQVKIEGRVNHISYESKTVNNVTTYEVDILPQEVPEFFRSGMSTDVIIIEKGRENVLLVPFEAVKHDKEGNFVFISRGKGIKPVRQQIEIGISDEKNVEVISGIKAEDKIIIRTSRYVPSKDTVSDRNPFMPSRRRNR